LYTEQDKIVGVFEKVNAYYINLIFLNVGNMHTTTIDTYVNELQEFVGEGVGGLHLHDTQSL